MKNTFIYNSKSTSKNLVVINHGVSEGIWSEFVTKISNKAYDSENDTLLVQMPYMDRKEAGSSTKELTEEVESVKLILEKINYQSYDKIHFIGKSLGGLILLNYIYQNRSLLPKDIEITLLGFLIEFTVLKPAEGLKINIIQGSRDKYGNKTQIEEIVKNNSDLNFDVKYIENADHSYRNTSKEPIYQDEAIGSIRF